MRVALRAAAVSTFLIVLTTAPVAYAAGSSDTSGEDQYGYVFPSSGGPKPLSNKPSHGSSSSASPSSGGAPATAPAASRGGSGSASPAHAASGASPSTGSAGALGSVFSRLPGTPGTTTARSGHRASAGHGQSSPFATAAGSGQGQSGTSFAPGRSFLSAFGNAAKTTGAAGILIVLLLVSLVTAGVTTLAIRGRRLSRRRI